MNEKNITAAIHQPNFLPWPGFFYKMMNSGVLVFLDDVQYVRRSIINRVKIKGPEGERWLTIPVINKGKYYQNINEVEIQANLPWRKKLLGSVSGCYGKAPYFKEYFSQFSEIIEREYRYLVEINFALIEWLSRSVGIEVKTEKASRLEGVTGLSTERLVSICEAVGAKRYLSGYGGSKYQEEELFHGHGIELAVYDFAPPVYEQLWGEFIPGLSTLDLLFNCGPRSKELILGQSNT